MAERRKGQVDAGNLGYFYYDWASSKYKWAAGPKKPDFKSNSRCTPAVENLLYKRKLSCGDLRRPLHDKAVNRMVKDQMGMCQKLQIGESCPDLTTINEQGPDSDEIDGTSVSKDETLQISKGHKTMISVLSTRMLRLQAAKTLWHKDTNAFIEYILRVQDDAVLVDLLPLLTNRVKQAAKDEQSLSMGACLEMLPALERLLLSRFEDYIIASLNMIREMIKKWWTQLKATTDKANNPAFCRVSRSVSGLYMAMVSMSAIIVKLKSRGGKVGEKAKVVSRLLDLL